MPDQLACNINFYLYTRFFFGFYHEFQTSNPVQWLARLYCWFICASIIFCNSLLTYNHITKILVWISAMEFFMYVLISLLKSNKYLLQYYKKTPLIDASTSTYRPMRVCLIGYNCVMFLVTLTYFLKILILQGESFATDGFRALFDFIMWFIVIIGRSPLLHLFALLYTRVKLMRQMLENNEFNCRIQGKHHPRRYIQMYEAIMDGLEASDGTVKLQFFVSVVFSIVYYTFGIIITLASVKLYGTKILNFLDITWLIVEIITGSSPLMLSAVLADLVSMETQKMLVVVLEKRLACKNERDRDEIQKLFQYLKRNTFEYSVWRVVPLNVRSLLSFVSFTVTTIIAILQIQTWNA